MSGFVWQKSLTMFLHHVAKLISVLEPLKCVLIVITYCDL